MVGFREALMVTSSIEPGNVSLLQFLASVQLSVPAPPSQETAVGVVRTSSAKSCGRDRNNRGKLAVDRIVLAPEIVVFTLVIHRIGLSGSTVTSSAGKKFAGDLTWRRS